MKLTMWCVAIKKLAFRALSPCVGIHLKGWDNLSNLIQRDIAMLLTWWRVFAPLAISIFLWPVIPKSTRKAQIGMQNSRT